MARFNTAGHKAKPAVAFASSPLGTVSKVPDTRTFEGGKGWTRSPEAELFLRATTSFHGGEGSFYEDGEKRDERLRELAAQVAIEDFTWFAQFAKWLRGPGNIRTAALMIAAEGAKARLDNKLVAVGDLSNRIVIDSVLQRPDEPGELLAYWTSRYGRKIPKPVKRGVADAVRRLYNERSLLKYDTASHSFRFADVLELVHASPDPEKSWQSDLFQYALDRRHHPDTARIPESLNMVWENVSLRKNVADAPGLLYSETILKNAGMTWEDALSLGGSKLDKRKLWEAMIPSMGVMAQIRNLRNFDEAGVSDKVAQQVISKLTDPEIIAKSRQLPFRFYSAYTHAPSLRWAHALEKALDASLPNIPEFGGKTLVLTDTSGSMGNPMSGKSKMRCLQAAALFGAALAIKNPDSVDLYHFASGVEGIPVPKGGSVLKLTEQIQRMSGRVGHGTEMAAAIRRTYSQHDRVIILSDMQAFGGYMSNVAESVPPHVPVYAFNISEYTASPMPTGDSARFDIGGLSDATFRLIPQLEAGITGTWPWEVSVQINS